MGLFREKSGTTLTYDIPFDDVWNALLKVLSNLGEIKQKSKLGKRISFRSTFFRGSVDLDISLEKVSEEKTKVILNGSSFGGLLQIGYSKGVINEVVEKLENVLSE